jgi:heme exporter protein A
MRRQAVADPHCIAELRNVWKRYSHKRGWVLREVNMCFREGEGYLVVGPNGSGKTTLLRLVAGLTKPSKGEVLVARQKPYTPQAKKVMGVVLHHSLLYDELTVRENLEYYAKLYGYTGYNPEEDPVVEKLGLTEYLDTKTGELSFGWKKRANIARALLHKPKLLIIDEPFTGLDDKAVTKLSEILTSLTKNNITVIATSPQTILPSSLENYHIYQIKQQRLLPNKTNN